jgi:hypothetical protein
MFRCELYCENTQIFFDKGSIRHDRHSKARRVTVASARAGNLSGETLKIRGAFPEIMCRALRCPAVRDHRGKRRAAIGWLGPQEKFEPAGASPTFPMRPVRLRCDVCKRAGAYRLARLAVKYGTEISLDDLLVRLSADCPWSDDPRGTCGARFSDMPPRRPPDLPAALKRFRVVKGGKQ